LTGWVEATVLLEGGASARGWMERRNRTPRRLAPFLAGIASPTPDDLRCEPALLPLLAGVSIEPVGFNEVWP
jgi:hypothetical protein